MFLGVTLETGKRYSQTVDQTYKISMAALEPPVGDGKKPSKFVSLMVEHEKAEYLLCTLNTEKNLQIPLDLVFTEGEEVTFFINGEGTVHLTGYIINDLDEYDEPYEQESFSEESEEDLSSLDSDSELEKLGFKVASKKRPNKELESSPEDLKEKKLKIEVKGDKNAVSAKPEEKKGEVKQNEKQSPAKGKESEAKDKVLNAKNKKSESESDEDDEDEEMDEEDDEDDEEDDNDTLNLLDREAEEADESEDEEDDEEEDEDESSGNEFF